LRETAAILKGLVQDISSHNPHGIVLIASNPVDVLTYAAWKWSGLPANRVIGSGTSLDTSRFRRRLAEYFGVASDNMHAYVIGEHGESQPGSRNFFGANWTYPTIKMGCEGSSTIREPPVWKSSAQKERRTTEDKHSRLPQRKLKQYIALLKDIRVSPSSAPRILTLPKILSL
jgi:hypothetical protein